MLALSEAIHGRGVRSTIVTLGPISGDRYAVPQGINRVGLDAQLTSRNPLSATWYNTARIWLLRRQLRFIRPTVIVSFIDVMNCLTLAASLGTSVPVIVSERTDPRRFPLASSWQLLRRRLYPRAARLVVQTDDLLDWGTQFLPPDRVVAIPNPVSRPVRYAQHVASSRKVAAVGRLHKEKRFDHLIRAFAAADLAQRGWTLQICGDGPERDALKEEAIGLGLGESVQLLGHVADVSTILEHAAMFVLCSEYEGFPNAMCEAMAAGVPVISACKAGGVGSIVTNEENGLIVGWLHPEELAEGLVRLANDPGLRQRIGSAGKAIVEKLSVTHVAEQWSQQICSVTEIGRGVN